MAGILMSRLDLQQYSQQYRKPAHPVWDLLLLDKNLGLWVPVYLYTPQPSFGHISAGIGWDCINVQAAYPPTIFWKAPETGGSQASSMQSPEQPKANNFGLLITDKAKN